MSTSTGKTTIDSGSLGSNNQNKCFYANGRHWLFYYDGTDGYWTSSADGTTWASAQMWRGTVNAGTYYSIYHDGTYIHYVYQNGTAGTIYYRRGTTDSSGNISWSASEQILSSLGTLGSSRPSIIVNSAGYAFIGYNLTGQYPQVIKNANNDGTWSNDGSPVQQNSTSSSTWRTGFVNVNGTPYMFYAYDTGTIYGRLWSSGTTWGSEETVSGSYTTVAISSVDGGADTSGNVYISFTDNTNKYLYVATRSTGGSWTQSSALSGAVTTAYFGICVLPNGNIYVFGANIPDSGYICYKKRTGGSWDGSWTDYSALSNIAGTSNTTYNNVVSSKVAVYSLAGSGSPWTFYFDGFDEASYNEWLPTSGSNANTAANWSLGHVPQTSEDIHFNSGSTAACTWDVTTSVGGVTVESGYTGTVTQSASFTNTGYSQAGGTWIEGSYDMTVNGDWTVTSGTWQGSGVGNKGVICSGNMTQSGGTLTAYYFTATMTGTGKTIDLASTNTIGHLNIDNNATITINPSVGYIRTEATFIYSGTFTIATGKYFIHRLYSSGYWINNGVVAGSGTGYMQFYTGNDSFSWTPGTITCPIKYNHVSGSTTNVTITLGDNAVFTNTFTMTGDDATETSTLDLNGYDFTCTLLDINVRMLMTSGVAGSHITATDITVDTSGTLTVTNISSITCTSFVTTGTVTGTTDFIIPTGTVTIAASAFASCTSMDSVTIPSACTTIGASAFSGCTALLSLTFYGLTAPTSVGGNWILSVPGTARGHAYTASNFPTPGNTWNGLTMGDYIDGAGTTVYIAFLRF
jgi:hypothetical protein